MRETEAVVPGKFNGKIVGKFVAERFSLEAFRRSGDGGKNEEEGQEQKRNPSQTHGFSAFHWDLLCGVKGFPPWMGKRKA